jgi:hypothetical protein
MLRTLIRFAILVLAVNACYQAGPVYLHHFQFKDAVGEVALFSKDRDPDEVVARVMVLAEKYGIPIDQDAVVVAKDSASTSITIQYEEVIEWAPTFKRQTPFTVAIEKWHVRQVDRLR